MSVFDKECEKWLYESLDKLYERYKHDGIVYLSDVCEELGLGPNTALALFDSYLKRRENQNKQD